MSKKTLIIAICLILLVAGISVFLILRSGNGSPQTDQKTINDSIRKSEMGLIAAIQGQYFAAQHKYYQSVSYPSSIPNSGPLPGDPSPMGTYFWIDNTGDLMKFCVYAHLENGGFYLASHKGVGMVQERPLTLSDCEKI